MAVPSDSDDESRGPGPRWPALFAVVVVGGLDVALRSDLVIGPPWLVPSAAALLLVPTVISHQLGRHHLDRWLGFAVTAVLTLGMIASLVLLVAGLPSQRQSATE